MLWTVFILVIIKIIKIERNVLSHTHYMNMSVTICASGFW